MPIYIEKGWFNEQIRVEKTDLNPIDWLKTYTPNRVSKGATILNGDVENMQKNTRMLMMK